MNSVVVVVVAVLIKLIDQKKNEKTRTKQIH